jgi:hypothetical protein
MLRDPGGFYKELLISLFNAGRDIVTSRCGIFQNSEGSDFVGVNQY